jgi:LAO/AO transport system kinase
VESRRPDDQIDARALLGVLAETTLAPALRVGISGPPGAGKSTLIEALGARALQENRRVAVLAIDPSSSISGGSILGDKTRMPTLAAAPDAFVRPTSAGGVLGGLARNTVDSVSICEAAGFDIVLVETVGVGQSEAAIVGAVDVLVLLVLPNAGDELQGLKKGNLEFADILLVNKADGPGVAAAELACGMLRAALGYSPHRSMPPDVMSASALTGAGIPALWDALQRPRQRVRKDRAEELCRNALQDALRDALLERAEFQRDFSVILREVVAGALSPYLGAQELLRMFVR